MRTNGERGISRREFLSRSVSVGAAAAASGLIGLPAWGAEGRWQMQLSTSTIHFSSLPIEQTCERIAALGFQAVDVWSAFGKPPCPHLDDILKRLGPDGFKEVLAKNNLKLYAFSVYVGGYAKYAELLGKLGGGVAIRGGGGKCKPEEITARTKVFLETLKPDLDLCDKYNSYLAVENHGGSLLDSLDSFKAFVDLNKHPRLGIALAPYHLQAGNVPVEETIKVCGKQLLFFYAWQRAQGVNQLPGLGPTDFTPWIAALAAINYPRYVNAFMHGEPEPDKMSEALAKSRDYLKQCYAKAVPA